MVGLATVTLQLHEAASLKDKRRVVKSTKDRVHRRFNVAIAEVDSHDAWGTITLGIACVSSDSAHAHAVLEKVVRWIDRERLDAVLAHYGIEILGQMPAFLAGRVASTYNPPQPSGVSDCPWTQPRVRS